MLFSEMGSFFRRQKDYIRVLGILLFTVPMIQDFKDHIIISSFAQWRFKQINFEIWPSDDIRTLPMATLGPKLS